jgi:RNA-directed DNA polymerase
VIIVRFADDFVAGFQYLDDAERFLTDLRERFAKFNLELATEKTRLIKFGRFAADARQARGVGKPETFDFVGFTHICAKSRTGRFMLKRVTISRRMQTKLRAVKGELRRRRHLPIPEQGKWLASVVRGHCAYYAVPSNSDAIHAFGTQAIRHWYQALRRRSQRGRLNWKRMNRLDTMAPTRPRDPPLARRAIRRSHPRQEPSALAAHAGICAGAKPAGRSLISASCRSRSHDEMSNLTKHY